MKSIISPELTINLIKHRFIISKHIIISKASQFWKGLGFHDSFFNSKGAVRFSRLKSHQRERDRELTREREREWATTVRGSDWAATVREITHRRESGWAVTVREKTHRRERAIEQRRWEVRLREQLLFDWEWKLKIDFYDSVDVLKWKFVFPSGSFHQWCEKN